MYLAEYVLSMKRRITQDGVWDEMNVFGQE